METKKRRVRRTPESYREEVEKLTNGEYSVLGDFANTHTKVLHIHNVCGYEWEVKPNDFINGGIRCSVCSGGGGAKDVRQRVTGRRSMRLLLGSIRFWVDSKTLRQIFSTSTTNVDMNGMSNQEVSYMTAVDVRCVLPM